MLLDQELLLLKDLIDLYQIQMNLEELEVLLDYSTWLV